MEQQLIKTLLDVEEYKKYSPYITKDIIVDSDYKLSDELWNIYLRLGKYYDKHEESISLEDLEKIMIAERANMSESSRELLKDTFKDLRGVTTTESTKELLRALRERSVRWEAMDLISDGEEEEAIRLLKSIDETDMEELKGLSLSLIERDNELDAESKWKWWLPSLDKALNGFGDERGMLLFARPNTGKSSTLCNAVVSFARQGAKVLYITIAEDTGIKLLYRLYSTAYDVDDEELKRFKMEYAEKFTSEFGDNIILRDQSTLTLAMLRDLVEEHNPDILVLDPFWKMSVKGKKDQRDDQHLAEIVRNIEVLAKDYKFGFICVTQAGADAEHKKNDGTKKPKRYLDMSDVYGSNTTVQGEFQMIVGVGTDGQGSTLFTDPKTKGHYSAEYRYFNICKNKGASGRITTIFNPLTGVIKEETVCKS